jgi:hypothetical protein
VGVTRRELLVGAGGLASAFVFGAPFQKAVAEVRADAQEPPGRKLRVIVAGGHPGDPESAPSGLRFVSTHPFCEKNVPNMRQMCNLTSSSTGFGTALALAGYRGRLNAADGRRSRSFAYLVSPKTVFAILFTARR